MVFRSIIRPILRKMGVDVVRHGPDRRFAPMLRAKWMNDMKVDIVLDIGANVGDWGEEVREYKYFGRVLSIEPVNENFKKLEARAKNDSNWAVLKAAAGPEKTRTKMHVSGDTVSNSILPIKDRLTNAAPDARYVREEEVDVITLDSLIGNQIKPADRVWLKMDAQGYEFSILEGAKALLPQIVGIEIELSVVPLYE